MYSQASEYALRAVVHLAQNGGGPSSARNIAAATKAPVGFLQKILRSLSRAGVLSAQRGAGGGFCLGRDPARISVLDILAASGDAIPRIERCPLSIRGHTRLCSLHQLLDTQFAGVETAFRETSIADLLNTDLGVQPLCEISSGSGPVVCGVGEAGEPDST